MMLYHFRVRDLVRVILGDIADAWRRWRTWRSLRCTCPQRWTRGMTRVVARDCPRHGD
jgi:hypothetical protein